MAHRAFAELKVGPVTLPNRIVRTAHATGFSRPTHSMTDRLIAYHVARARGGVGLSILEALAPHPSGRVDYCLHGGAPGLVEGYRKLMDAVRPHGMRVFQQLHHAGYAAPPVDGSPPWSASDGVFAPLGQVAVAINRRQIASLIESYVASTRDAAAGGLDGIEVHCGHDYLIQQFLSPLINRREDEYGGSFENRCRLALEIVTAVRAALPAHMALGVRLSSEMLPGGFGPDDVAGLAAMLQDRGLVDYLNLSIGQNLATDQIIGPMNEPVGYQLAHSAPTSAARRVPLLVTGRFRTIEEADQVISRGEADMVGMTRAHIADPDIVRLTKAGEEDRIRPCIACNHGCVGGLALQRQIGCAVNVAVGQEDQLAEDLIAPAPEARTVLVVGGGPAGLEAARVAALRGHRVILAEANSRLGGAVEIARRAPRRAALGDIVEWLTREVYRLGVDLRLSTYVEAEDVATIAPDHVIVATGSSPRMDGAQGFAPGLRPSGVDLPHVISSHDLFLDNTNRAWGSRALVVDDTGHYEAVAAAEFLIEQGVAVTFATGHISFAPRLEPSVSAAPALARLAKGDFTVLTRARLNAITPERATLAYHYSDQPIEVPADTVILVSHNRPHRELHDQLEERGIPATLVGDALSPRYLQSAIREAHLAARAIA